MSSATENNPGTHTARMVALLAAMRRERNGAVADAMRFYGASCGLNYGVSLPTVRRIARAESPDHEFARFLWRQEVRELKLAALYLADPARLVSDELPFWAAGILNSEIAEEAAFALLGRAGDFYGLFRAWLASGNPLLQYAVLMAAPRSPQLDAAWIGFVSEILRSVSSRSSEPYAGRLVAQGAVAFFAALGGRSEADRQAALLSAESLGDTPVATTVREELAWRL